MLPSLAQLAVRREAPTGGRRADNKRELDILDRLNKLNDTNSTNPEQVEHKNQLLKHFDAIQAMIESPDVTTQEAGMWLLSRWYYGMGLTAGDGSPMDPADAPPGTRVHWTRNLLVDRDVVSKIVDKLAHPTTEDPSDAHGDLQYQAVMLMRNLCKDIPLAWACARAGALLKLLDMLEHPRASPTSKDQKVCAAYLLADMVDIDYRYQSNVATNIVPNEEVAANQPMSRNAWIMHWYNGISILLKHLRSDTRYESGQGSAAQALAGIAKWARPYDGKQGETRPNLAHEIRLQGAFGTINTVLNTAGNTSGLTVAKYSCMLLLAKLFWSSEWMNDDQKSPIDELQESNTLAWMVNKIYTSPNSTVSRYAAETLQAMVSRLPDRRDASRLIRALPFDGKTGTEKLIDVIKREGANVNRVGEYKLRLLAMFWEACMTDTPLAYEFMQYGGFAWTLNRLTDHGDPDLEGRLENLVSTLVIYHDGLRDYAVSIADWYTDPNPNLWKFLNRFAPKEPPPSADNDGGDDDVSEDEDEEDAFTALCGHGMVWDLLAVFYARVERLQGPRHKSNYAFWPMRVGTIPGAESAANPHLDGWNWDYVAVKLRNMRALARAAAQNPQPSVQAAFMYMLKLQEEAEKDSDHVWAYPGGEELKVAHDELADVEERLKRHTWAGGQSEADRRLMAEVEQKRAAYAQKDELFRNSGQGNWPKMRLARRESQLQTLTEIEKVHRKNMLWGPVLEREITTTREMLLRPEPGNPIYESERRGAFQPPTKKQRTNAAFARVFDLSQEHAR